MRILNSRFPDLDNGYLYMTDTELDDLFAYLEPLKPVDY
jgi:hypothetical protein